MRSLMFNDNFSFPNIDMEIHSQRKDIEANNNPVGAAAVQEEAMEDMQSHSQEESRQMQIEQDLNTYIEGGEYQEEQH